MGLFFPPEDFFPHTPNLFPCWFSLRCFHHNTNRDVDAFTRRKDQTATAVLTIVIKVLLLPSIANQVRFHHGVPCTRFIRHDSKTKRNLSRSQSIYLLINVQKKHKYYTFVLKLTVLNVPKYINFDSNYYCY